MQIVVITSRNDHDYPYAIQFIKDKFGGLIKYVHNTRNEPKGKFVSRLRPRVHVDDDLTKLLELQEYPVELIYYRQPENEGQEISASCRSRIWEARSFTDVLIIIRRIKALHQAICLKEKIENNWTNLGRIYSVLHLLSSKQISVLLADFKPNL